MTVGVLHPFGTPDASGRIINGLKLDKLLALSCVDRAAPVLSAAEHTLMMLNSIDMTGDEGHALGIEPIRKGYASVGIRSMLSRPTLGDALTVLSRYFAATSSVFTLEITRVGGVAHISLRARAKDPYSGSVLEEIWFNALYAFSCWFVGRRIPIRAATLALANQPTRSSTWLAQAGSMTASSATGIEIFVGCLSWERATSTVQEPVWEAMSAWLEQHDHAGPSQGAGWLRSTLDAAEAPARTRAREAGGGDPVSGRQLARRLQRRHGAGFRQLRSEALVGMAEELLLASPEPIEAIAARLGYAEERSFRRFVRKHTGLTPAQLRRGAPRASSGPSREVMDRIHILTRKIDI